MIRKAVYEATVTVVLVIAIAIEVALSWMINRAATRSARHSGSGGSKPPKDKKRLLRWLRRVLRITEKQAAQSPDASHQAAETSNASDLLNRQSTLIGTLILSPRDLLRQSALNRRTGANTPVEDEVRLSHRQRREHVYLLGRTGVGKTVLLTRLMLADVARGSNTLSTTTSKTSKCNVVVIDTRGDLADKAFEAIAATLSPEELADRLYIVELRAWTPFQNGNDPRYSVGFNLLIEAGVDADASAYFILDVLVEAFDMGAPTQEIARNALRALAWSTTVGIGLNGAGRRGRLTDLTLFLTCEKFRSETLLSVPIEIQRFFRSRFPELSQNPIYVGAIVNKLSVFLSSAAARCFLDGGVAKGVDGRGLSLMQILEKPGAILLVALGSSEIGEVASQLLGQMFLTALHRASIRTDIPLHKLNETNVFIDEVENVAHNEASRAQLIRFAEEGRRYGVGLHIAHQAISQLDTRFRSIFRNCSGLQFYMALGSGDSATVAGELPSEEPQMILRNRLNSQDKGEAFIVETAKPLRRIKVLMPDIPPVDAATVAQVRRTAMERWGTPISQMEAERERLERFYYGDDAEAATEPSDTSPAKPRNRRKTAGKSSSQSTESSHIVGVEVLDSEQGNTQGGHQ